MEPTTVIAIYAAIVSTIVLLIQIAEFSRNADDLRLSISTGVALGAVGAWLLTGLLKTMLNDVKPTDGAVFAGTAVAVLLVAVVASYLPARAAGRVDPMVVLRDA